MKKIAIVFSIISVLFGCSHNKTATTGFSVMTFNMWHGGESGKQPMDKTIEVMLKGEADIVSAQQTYGRQKPKKDNSKLMADSMGWNHKDLGDNALLSKYNIVEKDKNSSAVKVQVAEDKLVWFVPVRFMYKPYQPYQLNNKKYGDYPFISTEEEAIEWANKARKHQVDALVKLVTEKKKDGLPIILVGDFNEPSHLDWTEKAAKAGLCKTKVKWPATKAFTDIGFKDAYREIYPDEVAKPGYTWTPLDAKGEIHDRIDMIFYWGDNLKVTDAKIVGERTGKADIIIKNYPSDHRAVVATFEWE